MELDVSNLAADGLRLELDGPGDRKRVITLEPSKGVTGRYKTDSRAYYIDATSDSLLSFAGVDWPSESSHVQTFGVRADRAAVDLKIKRRGGTSGQIGARQIDVNKITVALEGNPNPIVLRKLSLGRPGLALGDKALALVCQHASVERVELHLGGLEIVLHGVHLTGLRLRRGQGVWLILAESMTARRIAIQQGEVSLIAENVEAQSVGLDGKVIRWARVFAPRAHLSAARRNTRDEPPADSAPPDRSAAPRMVFDALDGLDGKIDVDLTVDATLPVIGGRRATHHFRMPVDSGTINYNRLEKSLSALEDAVLDFNIRGNDLVLERDIPLMKKTLVSWPLQKDDMALAKRHLIRISRLLDYRIERDEAKSPDEDAKKSSVELRELSFDGLDVRLSLAGGASLDLPRGGRIELGADGRPAVDELTLRGAVRYKLGAQDRTKLEVAASQLNVGLDAIPLGSRSFSVSSITVDTIEKGSIRFAGVSPDRLDATLRDVEILSLRLVPR